MVTHGHPRTHRLLTSGDFRAVFDQVEVKTACPEFLLLARPSPTDDARLGFILSKKNVRRAVARNRIKRIAREVFRLNYHDLPPLDIIFLARKGIDRLTNEQLHHLINKQLNRLIRRWQRIQQEKADIPRH